MTYIYAYIDVKFENKKFWHVKFVNFACQNEVKREKEVGRLKNELAYNFIINSIINYQRLWIYLSFFHKAKIRFSGLQIQKIVLDASKVVFVVPK